jgi:O-antigen/teichoic acid export membrane protein
MYLLKDKVITGIKWLSFLQVFRYLVELIIIVFTARLISPENFGVVAISLSIIAVADTFSETGLKTAIIQFKDDTLVYLNSAWTLQNLRSLILYLLLFILVDPITSLYEIDYIYLVINILALRIFLQSLTNPYLNYNVRDMSYKNIVIINILGSLSRLFFVIPLAYFFQNYWALVIGALISPFIKCCVSYIIIDYRPRLDFDKDKIFRLLNFGGWLWASRIVFSLTKIIPNFFIGQNFGLITLGGYKQAEQLGTIIEQVFKKISANILLPLISKLNRNNYINKKVIQENIVCLISISISIGIFGFFYSNLLVNIILGPKWVFSIPIVKMYFIIGAILFFCNTLSTFIIGIGNVKLDFFGKLINFLILCTFMLFCSSVHQILMLLILSFAFQALVLTIWIIYKYKINFFYFLTDLIIFLLPLVSVPVSILFFKNNYDIVSINYNLYSLIFSFLIFTILTYLQFRLSNKGLLKTFLGYWK